MRAPFLLVASLALLVAATPTVQGQSLADRLAELHFDDLIITIAPKSTAFEANGGTLTSNTARDLRRCIDNTNCPDSQLAGISPGNRDGSVTRDEVDEFEQIARDMLNFLGGDIKEFRDLFGEFVSVDDQGATKVEITDLQLRDAEGSVSSTQTIHVSFRLVAEYGGVGGGDSHSVRVHRDAPAVDIVSSITIRPGSGWKIKEDSILPPSMQAFFDGSQFSGSQSQMQGTEPVTFTLESTGGGSLGLWLLILGLLAVGGGFGFYWWKRRKGQAGVGKT